MLGRLAHGAPRHLLRSGSRAFAGGDRASRVEAAITSKKGGSPPPPSAPPAGGAPKQGGGGGAGALIGLAVAGAGAFAAYDLAVDPDPNSPVKKALGYNAASSAAGSKAVIAADVKAAAKKEAPAKQQPKKDPAPASAPAAKKEKAAAPSSPSPSKTSQSATKSTATTTTSSSSSSTSPSSPSSPAPSKPKPAPIPAPTTTPDLTSDFAKVDAKAGKLKLQSLADANAELSAVSASLKKELDETLGADLTALSASDLRYRVAQLTAELHERSKWEALRLRAFMLSAERETADKYRGLMQEQRLKYEEALARELREQEDRLGRANLRRRQEETEALKERFEAEWTRRRDEWASAFKAESERALGDAIAAAKAEYASSLASRAAEIEAARAELGRLQAVVERGGQYSERSAKVHRVVGGVMGLIGSIEAGDAGVDKDVEALREVAGDDEVIGAALKGVGERLRGGRVMTVGEIQDRFEKDGSMGRRAALSGEGPLSDGLGGLIKGTFFSVVTSPIDPALALKKKPADLTDEDRIERARHYVRIGGLQSAVAELGFLEGDKVKRVMEGVKEEIEVKIAVDDCVKILKLRCAALNNSMKG